MSETVLTEERMTLAALRVRAGYSQVEAANLLGVSKVTLIKWEADSRTININQIEHIKKLYQVKYDNIYFGVAAELSAMIKSAFKEQVEKTSKSIEVKGE